jgi:hypothetical protein
LATKQKIHLREFFRTGMFGPVRLGMSKAKIRNLLGEPDEWQPPNDPHYVADTAPAWVYAGGVEFFFGDFEALPNAEAHLSSISFKPNYLWWNRAKTSQMINRWIFRSWVGPTVVQLKSALEQEQIPYQDTGLQTMTNNPFEGLRMLPTYEPNHEWADEHFGTIVIKSGVQVRYDDSYKVIRVRIASDLYWMIAGKEADIHWD